MPEETKPAQVPGKLDAFGTHRGVWRLYEYGVGQIALLHRRLSFAARKAVALRIVASYNACAGISTERLDAGPRRVQERAMKVFTSTLWSHGCRERDVLSASPTQEWEIDRDRWVAEHEADWFYSVTVPPSLRQVIEGQERLAAEIPADPLAQLALLVGEDFDGMTEDDIRALRNGDPLPAHRRNDVETVRCGADCPTADLGMEER